MGHAYYYSHYYSTNVNFILNEPLSFVALQHDNLRMVIAHGLQCVVKKKHSAAEVIFTQALFLPDFQRIELKAFAYICLAVVAYRRKNAE